MNGTREPPRVYSGRYVGETGAGPALNFMKETDGGEAAFEHLPVMYPLDVDQLHRRVRCPCMHARLDNFPVIYSIIGPRVAATVLPGMLDPAYPAL